MRLRPIPKAQRPAFEPAQRTCAQCGAAFTPNAKNPWILGSQFFCGKRCTWRWRDLHRASATRFIVPGMDIVVDDLPRCTRCHSQLPQAGTCAACVVQVRVDRALQRAARKTTHAQRTAARLAAHDRFIAEPRIEE